jgi:hypothetical protein
MSVAPNRRPRSASPIFGALLACASLACDPERVPVPSNPPRVPSPQLRAEWQRSIVGDLDCPAMATTANLCVVTDVVGQVLLVDLDGDPDQRATTCTTKAYASRGAFGWLGGRLYACDRATREVIAVDLVDGALRVSPLADDPVCDAVTRWGTRLVVIGAKVQIFESFDDLERGRPSRVIEVGLEASHAVVVADILHTSGSSDESISRLSLTTGARLPPLPLDVEGPISAMAATAAGELVLVRPPWLVTGAEFVDLQTGATLRRARLDSYVQAASFGLACDGVWGPGSPSRPMPTNPVRFGGACKDEAVAGFDAGDAPAGFEPVAELHVVGVQSATTGTVTVEVDRPGPVHLVLLGYDPVHWTVWTSRRTELRSVVVSGYGRATLTAPTAGSSEFRIFEAGGVPLGYGYRWESYEARRVRYELESSLDLPMRSFSGCSDGERFELR